MPEKTPKRVMLESSLADDPSDAFLRYGLALQCLREGDLSEGRERLLSLIHDDPENQVAAYQQLGQSYMETEENPLALEVLERGIAKAKKKGDWHAASEMEGFLNSIG